MFVITMLLHLSAFEFLLMGLPIAGLEEWCMERTCAATNVRCFCVLVPLVPIQRIVKTFFTSCKQLLMRLASQHNSACGQYLS